MLSKDVINNVDLARCERCGVTIAPKLQTAKLGSILTANEIEMSLLNHCNRCKKIVGRNSALVPTAWDSTGDADLNTLEVTRTQNSSLN
jgi:light-regulated signal transduction histidine kinase (bacteriophytochrome)